METKICTKCGKELPIEEFNWRSKARGTRRSECKYCHSGYMKQKYQDKRQEIEKLKETFQCAKCGDSRGYVLDFHHIDPSTKTDTIARLICGTYKIDKVYDEINKCICLCANCHREFHHFNTQNNITLEEYLQ
jgi:DNA-directed RNA polymerase subunit RPC12/RpoP